MTHHARLLKSTKPAEYLHEEPDAEIVYSDHFRLGIDEARNLRQQATRTPTIKMRQVLVVRVGQQITVEAQNALLKLLEEPPQTTSFVLVVPLSLQLLPTLLSRVLVTQLINDDSYIAWETFKAAAVADRLSQIDSWQKKKDADWLSEIQAGLRAWLGGGVSPSASLQLITERLNTRGASNKMLLEALALDSRLQNK